MPEIIVNTSPLQYLYQLGQLDLLTELFGRVTVTPAVQAELEVGRRTGLSLPDPLLLDWVDSRRPSSPAGVLLSWDLGAGESEVLSLAVENPGAWVILDDRVAREAAKCLRLPLLGTVGVLLRAKQSGAITAIEPMLSKLASLGFRLNPTTRNIVLSLAGEKA